MCIVQSAMLQCWSMEACTHLQTANGFSGYIYGRIFLQLQLHFLFDCCISLFVALVALSCIYNVVVICRDRCCLVVHYGCKHCGYHSNKYKGGRWEGGEVSLLLWRNRSLHTVP